MLTTRNMKRQQRLIQQQQQDAEWGVSGERKMNMNKADILHQTADMLQQNAMHIEQLERQLAELTDSHSRRHSLQSSMLTRSTTCVLVIHVPSGCVTDASERYLQHTHFERSWLVGRRLFPPWQELQSNPLGMTRLFPCTPEPDRVLCKHAADDDGGGQLQPTVHQPQSESTIRLMHQLCSGEIDTMFAIWRGMVGDGHVMEHAGHSWVSEWTEHEDGTRTPLYVTGVASTSETVCVE